MEVTVCVEYSKHGRTFQTGIDEHGRYCEREIGGEWEVGAILVTCGCCNREVEICTTTRVGVSEDCWEYICAECLS
jgi:hypothetical protein